MFYLILIFDNKGTEGSITIFSQYSFKKLLSAVYQISFLSVDLSHWYDDGIDAEVGDQIKVAFLTFSFKKVFTSFALYLTYTFLVVGLILLPCFYQF